MAAFLSAEWFSQLRGPLSLAAESQRVVLEVTVAGGPSGEVRYQVVVAGNTAQLLGPMGEFCAPDVRFSCDYATISDLATGTLTGVEALARGRARVAGDISALARLRGPIDIVPGPVRAATTF